MFHVFVGEKNVKNLKDYIEFAMECKGNTNNNSNNNNNNNNNNNTSSFILTITNIKMKWIK